MYVGVDILRAVILHDPLHSRKIDTSGGNICAEEDRVLSLSKLKVDGSTLGLLLATVKLQERYSNFEASEGLIGKSDLFTGGEEHDAFVFLMCLQE